MMSDWQQFEQGVAAFCQALAPNAKVTHDAIIPDVDTGEPRQRDVWIETTFGGHFKLKLLVSCKRLKRRINSQHLDAFIGELASSGAHKGVVYSASGFTKAALNKATKRGISCCVLLANQPPPIPEVLSFHAYCLNERLRLFAEGVSPGEVDWAQLLNGKGEFEGKLMPAHRALACLFAADLPALREAIPKTALATRRPVLTLWNGSAEGPPIRLGIQTEWAAYRAKIEAWLVNGSYSFTDNDFKGSITTPVIDTWSFEPGPGWEPITLDEMGAGNNIRVYRFLGDVGRRLAEVAATGISS